MRLTQAFLLAVLVALLAACHHAPTEQEKQVMAQLSQSMKTQCMGRYLVDLPDGFKWLTPDLTLYYGKDKNFKTLEVQVLDTKATPESFDEAVGAEAAKIRAETIFGTSTSLLLAQTKTESGGTMLRYYSDASGIGLDHQLHLLVGHSHVLIKGSSYEGVDDTEDALSPAVEARMLKLATHIHPVTDPEKAGSGFCLGGVVVDSDNDYENADMTFDMAKHPDLTFDVWMDNQSNPSDTLLERMKEFDAMADGRRLEILRSHDTTVAGMPAQEKLARIEEDRLQFKFTLETRPASPSFAQEGMQVNLSTGNQLRDGRYIDSTLTKNEVLSLWDVIVKSFRPRPNAVRPAAQ